MRWSFTKNFLTFFFYLHNSMHSIISKISLMLKLIQLKSTLQISNKPHSIAVLNSHSMVKVALLISVSAAMHLEKIRRASCIECEHVMPAENFGRHLQCWRNGGRKECKKDVTFNTIKGDLHNLQPSIDEVNGDRSNYRYSQFTKTFN